MKPVRLQLSRKRGWKLQAASQAVNGLPGAHCARPSRWGNPFKVGKDAPDAFDAVDKFENWLLTTNQGLEIFSRCKTELRGKNLFCYCKPGEPCHAQTLLRIANENVDSNASAGRCRRTLRKK